MTDAPPSLPAAPVAIRRLGSARVTAGLLALIGALSLVGSARSVELSPTADSTGATQTATWADPVIPRTFSRVSGLQPGKLPGKTGDGDDTAGNALACSATPFLLPGALADAVPHLSHLAAPSALSLPGRPQNPRAPPTPSIV